MTEFEGALIVLIPAETDPVTAASSQPAHMTTVWFGDESKLTVDRDELEQAVRLYAQDLDGPVVVPVLRRGTLGDDDADVVFLEPTEAIIALRDGLLVNEPIREAHDAVEQYPQWTPHVTLGYPEEPATGEYDGDAVTFDRIGLWIGEERLTYTMGGVVSDKIEAAAVVEDDVELDQDEMPVDELEEGEEEVTEIPVHGVATLEGKPTGDGRGFRPGSISFGRLPAPLGYEFEHGHGGDNSRVAVVGRIDEFWTVEADEPGVFEVRWRGVMLTTKPYAAQAIESIIDGSYDGLSVIVDSVEIDVEEQREEMRARILAEQAGGPAGGPVPVGESPEGEAQEMTPEEIESLIDAFVGDGKMETTWFTAARVRRFDMVPTGAYQEGYIALGAEFPDELTPDQIEASVQALADCGCAGSREEAEAIIASAVGFAPGTKDGPGWITHPTATARIRRYWVKGKGAAKIRWGAPGDFNRCRMQLAKYVQNPEWLAGLCANMHKEAIGVWPGQEHDVNAIVAAATPAPLFRPERLEPIDASYFANPNLTEPTGVTIDGDRVYGHIAAWNVCHVGQPDGYGSCTYAPRSRTNYAHFRTGTIPTTEGPMAVGSITMGTGHAGDQDSAAHAASHYDNTGTVIADVACGEDAHGIWFSGRIRPNADPDDIFALAASGRLSGDWRRIGSNYELVAALAVNVPGFPIPKTSLVASAALGGLSAIIAAGVVTTDEEAEAVPLTSADLGDVVELALAAFEQRAFADQRQKTIERATSAKAAFRAQQLATARKSLASISEG